MKKRQIKEQYQLSERLFWKLVDEDKIKRTSYRDYEVDKDDFADFSIAEYWKSYSQRPDVIRRRQEANEKRSETMRRKHGTDK